MGTAVGFFAYKPQRSYLSYFINSCYRVKHQGPVSHRSQDIAYLCPTASEMNSSVSSSDSSEPLTQFSFSLFAKLPPELQLEIFSNCQQNDLICISLASHSLRALSLPLIPAKPSLLLYDQTQAQGALKCKCGNDSLAGIGQDNLAHRKRRHVHVHNSKYDLSHARGCTNWSPCRNYGPDHPLCRQRWCKHCLCTSCPLYTRLRGWMGDQKYCLQCRKFTNRMQTKKYKGRCLHGRQPTRKIPNNYWTAKKGRSYGVRWWRRFDSCYESKS
ncbi:F-box domain-containing protein [Colletotrichum truncatum]|uniref:F-box domain-containing protein n=1 Tax=Colletotrichum truncatum TaxID=5467 RepID=A0ACC3YE46_COLTU|nr:F-box domain-containing protein [Colletotrichum truncatum]KAF6790161.1 F-box domain-containing protein [Colletotrichum truncatum]